MAKRKEKVLNVGNKSHLIYLRSGMIILANTKKLTISGLGSAIVTACRLAGALVDTGNTLGDLKLEFRDMPGRIQDPSTKEKKFIATGKIVKVPRLSIHLTQ